MKKTIICNIPMRERIAKVVYSSEDQSLPVSEKAFRFPINSFLSQTLNPEDEVRVILLAKRDDNKFTQDHVENYQNEIKEVCETYGIKSEIIIIDTAFTQNKETHEHLMGKIIDEIEEDSHILVDITYGPKDLPVVIFSALGFAEKFLRCNVDNIVYGQAKFDKKTDEVVGSVICDMIPLYYLSSVTNTIKCDEPEKARQMLKSLLSL